MRIVLVAFGELCLFHGILEIQIYNLKKVINYHVPSEGIHLNPRERQGTPPIQRVLLPIVVLMYAGHTWSTPIWRATYRLAVNKISSKLYVLYFEALENTFLIFMPLYIRNYFLTITNNGIFNIQKYVSVEYVKVSIIH